MKKFAFVATAGVAFGLFLGQPVAVAANCGDGSENLQDNPATAQNENTDDLVVTPIWTVYGDAVVGEDGGYIGFESENGYGELGGDNGSIYEGQSADGTTSYSVSQDGEACTP